jgi:hypothetical protein
VVVVALGAGAEVPGDELELPPPQELSGKTAAKKARVAMTGRRTLIPSPGRTC